MPIKAKGATRNLSLLLCSVFKVFLTKNIKRNNHFKKRFSQKVKKHFVCKKNFLSLQILIKKNLDMARVCDLTGKKTIVGNRISHSNVKTKRRFYPNLQTKKFYIPEEDAWIVLKVSTSAMKTINKKGIYAYLKELESK